MLNSGDRLLGFAGQSMGGPKVRTTDGAAYLFPGGYTFTAPISGYYKFVARGGGGSGNANNAGGSAAYGEVTKLLAIGQNVAISVGGPSGTGGLAPPSQQGGTTALTFPDGVICTAGGGFGACNVSGTQSPGGTASGFDLNLNGSAGGTSGVVGAPGNGSAGGPGGGVNGGAGAPGNAQYPGPPGTTNGTTTSAGPGAGGGFMAGSANNNGGWGCVIVSYVRPA